MILSSPCTFELCELFEQKGPNVPWFKYAVCAHACTANVTPDFQKYKLKHQGFIREASWF